MIAGLGDAQSTDDAYALMAASESSGDVAATYNQLTTYPASSSSGSSSGSSATTNWLESIIGSSVNTANTIAKAQLAGPTAGLQPGQYVVTNPNGTSIASYTGTTASTSLSSMLSSLGTGSDSTILLIGAAVLLFMMMKK